MDLGRRIQILTVLVIVSAGLLIATGCVEQPAEQNTEQISPVSAEQDTDSAMAPVEAKTADATQETPEDSGAASSAASPANAAPVAIDVRFLKARYNDDPDATLSHLRFDFSARVGRGKRKDTEVELSGADDVVMAELDLGTCTLQMFPIVSPPVYTGNGSLGEVGLRFDGMYQIRLLLPDGTLVAMLGVSDEGELMSAPPEESPEGYSVTSRHKKDDYGPPKFQVYKTAKRGEPTEVLFTLTYETEGYESHEVIDPDNNILTYRFPQGRLNVMTGKGD